MGRRFHREARGWEAAWRPQLGEAAEMAPGRWKLAEGSCHSDRVGGQGTARATVCQGHGGPNRGAGRAAEEGVWSRSGMRVQVEQAEGPRRLSKPMRTGIRQTVPRHFDEIYGAGRSRLGRRRIRCSYLLWLGEPGEQKSQWAASEAGRRGGERIACDGDATTRRRPREAQRTWEARQGCRIYCTPSCLGIPALEFLP